MANFIKTAQADVKEIILSAIGRAIAAGELPKEPLPAFVVEITTDASHGDFAANVAMIGAKSFRMPPRQIAQTILSHIVLEGTYFNKAEVAGPGFLNFFLHQRWYADVLLNVSREKEQYGKSTDGNGQKIMVEFVSANPTGPMHIGNARGGALGDCLSSVLEWAGYTVSREFYINDAGNQIEKFALSLESRYLQIYKGEEAVPFPEDAYHGEDIKVHAQNFADIHGSAYINSTESERRKAITDYALPLNIQKLKTDLERYCITYDNWFHESSLYSDGSIDKILTIMKDKGATYEKEGALWYQATKYGGEKDEVLVRENGNPTYFCADIAYHYNKIAARGFDKCIDIWGADHHGHVDRLKGALGAIGISADKLDVVLMQMVRLVRDGETVKVSKRTGKSITLVDLLDEIPIDAARFFFNLRESNSHFDFDLDLAIKNSSQNPVYYVQYAHARICSILKNLEKEGVFPQKADKSFLDVLTSSEETALIKHIASFTETVSESAKAYDPSKITRYVNELATLFHKFYNSHKVKTENSMLMQGRLCLCIAVQTTVKNALAILKVNAPESM